MRGECVIPEHFIAHIWDLLKLSSNRMPNFGLSVSVVSILEDVEVSALKCLQYCSMQGYKKALLKFKSDISDDFFPFRCIVCQNKTKIYHFLQRKN